jgi:tripartite-type tricarboxylate transporter receptor subunit TctC
MSSDLVNNHLQKEDVTMRSQRNWMLILLLSLVFSTALFMPLSAVAMEKPGGYPDRPITIVTCYGKGGGSDQLCRAMATPLEKIIGVPVIIVNKAGGGGIAGLSEFRAYKPDGYTLLQHIDVLAAAYAQGQIKENPAVDFTPLGMAQLAPSQLFVHPNDERFPDWDSFHKYVKANPGKINISNVGTQGSMEVLMMYQLKKALGLDINEVTIGESSQRYASLVGRHVDALFEQPGDVIGFVQSNDMKPILTFLNFRPEAFAETPCLKDIGVDIDVLWRFRGFYGPKGMAEDRAKYMEWAIKEAWNSPEFQKFNKSKYMDLVESYRDSEGAKEMIAESVEAYKKLYKELGIKTK